MEKYYGVQEAAEALNVDYKVVYRLVREGRIPSERVGWQFRISESSLNAYINAQRVKQEAVAQSLRSDAMAPQGVDGVAQPAQANGVNPPPAGISKLEARQMELNFINRFKEKVGEIETLRHPLTKAMIHIVDWAPLLTESDGREQLMHLLNTAFLDRTVLATTPRNPALRYTVPGAMPLVIEARVRAHLDAFCTQGVDNAPATQSEVMEEIARLEESGADALTIVGLASPTGWEREAIRYIGGSERGNSFRSTKLKLLLVDLRSEAVYADRHDALLSGFVGLFELPTEAENISALRARLLAEIDTRLTRGVILREFATELGAPEPLLLEAARGLAAGGRLRLLEDPRHGPILVES